MSENSLSSRSLVDTEPGGCNEEDIDAAQLRVGISLTLDLLKYCLLKKSPVISLRRHHNSLVPIHRLPPEVLSMSIKYALSDVEVAGYQRRTIQLSTVCFWWRDLMLGNPFIWGIICSQNSAEIVTLALQRSRNAPLTLCYERSQTRRSGMHALSQFLKTLRSHDARWADVTLALPSSQINMQSLSEHGIQLPRCLKRLVIRWVEARTPVPNDPVIHFYGHTDQLSVLHLHRLAISTADIIRVLASSCRLICLDLKLLLDPAVRHETLPSNNEPDDITQIPTINLPRLTSLSLRQIPVNILGLVVQKLNPSTMEVVNILHDTEVDGGALEGPRNPYGDSIAGFVARTACTLEWTTIKPQSAGVVLYASKNGSTPTYTIELRGRRPELLRWLRSRSLALAVSSYSIQLEICSTKIGGDLDEPTVGQLKLFPRVLSLILRGRRELKRWMWLLTIPQPTQGDSRPLTGDQNDNITDHWLWPSICYMKLCGDVDEYAILNFLLARYGEVTNPSTDGALRRLNKMIVQPGTKAWRPEVFDRIKSLVGPGRFRWTTA